MAGDLSCTDEVAHARDGVWAFLTSPDEWASWWGDDALVGADPDWVSGGRLRFASGWSPPIHECTPPAVLAFGDHRIELADDGGSTRISWSCAPRRTGFDEIDSEVEDELRDRMERSLERLAEALTASARRLGSAFVAGERGAAPSPLVTADRAPVRQVRVFVSSTFKDMAVERDELSKRAFVELRSMCEERGVMWADVDLRWGITDEQRAEGEVLPICFSEIELCHPFFIGILGERYGWVPDRVPDGLVERHPWLNAASGRSVTELEIAHAVLDDSRSAEHAFFYFRDPAYVDSQPEEIRSELREEPAPEDVERVGVEEAERIAAGRRARLRELKARIEATGRPVARYCDPRELSPLVVRDLAAVLDRLYPLGSAPSPVERERAAHLGAMRDATRGFVPRPLLAEELDRAVAAMRSVLVTGEVGAGTTALLADWVAARSDAAPPGEQLISHFVGASSASASWTGLVRRLVTEMGRRLGVETELPDRPDLLRRAFVTALHTAAAQGRWIIVIDGLDELEDEGGALDLGWLPANVPPQVCLVVSSGPGRPVDELTRRQWPTLTVPPLDPADRRVHVRAHLAEYGKALTEAQLDRVVSASQTANPLFVHTLVEELRLHGDHLTLDAAIDRHLRCEGLAELHDVVLERLEVDYERERPGLVRDVLSLLSSARRGLGEQELLDLLGSGGRPLPQAVWSPFHLAARHLVVERSGLLGLRHGAVRAAAVRRYLPGADDRRLAHAVLADYFEQRGHGLRRTDELPWQLSKSEDWDGLAAALSDLELLEAAWPADEFDVRQHWAQVEQRRPGRMLDAFRSVVERPPPQVARTEIVASLLGGAGHWEEALRLRAHLADVARATGGGALAGALGNQAHVLNRMGAWDRALALYEEQETVARSCGDHQASAVALGGQASILRKRGDLAAADALLERQAEIVRALHDERGLQWCLGARAQVASELGRRGAAMELRAEQEAICRATGQVDGLASAVEGRSLLQLAAGDLDAATASNLEAAARFDELGDRAALATCLINRGIIQRARGEPGLAMASLRDAEAICRDIGERQDLVVALENQAVILGDDGELAGAMERYHEVETISRELGHAEGLLAALANRARLLLQQGDAAPALGLVEEAEQIGRQMGAPRPLAECLDLRGAALHALGRSQEAESAWSEAAALVERHGLRR